MQRSSTPAFARYTRADTTLSRCDGACRITTTHGGNGWCAIVRVASYVQETATLRTWRWSCRHILFVTRAVVGQHVSTDIRIRHVHVCSRGIVVECRTEQIGRDEGVRGCPLTRGEGARLIAREIAKLPVRGAPRYGHYVHVGRVEDEFQGVIEGEGGRS